MIFAQKEGLVGRAAGGGVHLDVKDEGFAEDLGGVIAAVKLAVEAEEAAESGELGGTVGFEAGGFEAASKFGDGLFRLDGDGLSERANGGGGVDCVLIVEKRIDVAGHVGR